MYVQKKLRRKISAAIAAVMILGNSLNAAAAPAQERISSRALAAVETDAYKAELDLEKGSVQLSRYKPNKNSKWSVTNGMNPGATMLLGDDGQVIEPAMTVDQAFDNTVEDGGSAGIHMSGELSGVKSWFLFGDEIVCLGAGIEKTSEDTAGKVINVVDNVAANYLKLGLVKPDKGFRIVSNATTGGQNKGQWISALDTVTPQTPTDAQNWLCATKLSGSPYPLEWYYIFGDTLTKSNVYCRFPTTDGTTASRFELWLEPVGGKYQYTLGAKGGTSGDFGTISEFETQNKVLSNTESLQAAESSAEGLMAVNKWTAGPADVTGEVADVSLDQPVSLFVKKTAAGDQAFIIVSGLSAGASSPIELSVDLKTGSVPEINNLPEAVTTHKVEGEKMVLTLDAAKLTSPVTVEVSLKTPEDLPETVTSVETSGYKANLNLSQGTLLLSRNSDKTEGWNTGETISPGATMVLGGDNQIRAAKIRTFGIFDNIADSGGAAGVRMSGELSGVKSWFLFDREVVCLGAGIKKTSGSTEGTVINIVDNVTVDNNLKVALPNPWPGYRGVVTATAKVPPADKPDETWSSVLDTVTAGKHSRNWLNASGLTDSTQPLEWRYVFGDTISNSKVYYRFPTNDGKAARFELWVEPVKDLYQYTLGAGGVQEDFKNVGTADTQNKVLNNTENLQAAESPSEGVLAVNKWTSGAEAVAGEVANVSLNQPVSLFIKKTEDKAVLTVSRLSTDTSSVELSADLGAESVISISDPASVTANVDGGKVFLTLDGAEPAGPVTVEVSLKKPVVLPAVETSGYRAELDLNQGMVLLSRNDDKTKEWNTAHGMSPGATMFLDSDNRVRAAEMTVAGAFDNRAQSGGAAGIRMSGELSGVKSWFLFDNEVVCLGAGIENTGESGDKVINIVDNVAVDSTLRLGLTNPNIGYREVLKAVADTDPSRTWKDIVDTVTKGNHTTRNWLCASNLPATGDQPLQWRYIFDDIMKDANVYYRFPTVNGTVARFELWKEPVGGVYQYTLGAGGMQKTLPVPAETQNKILKNTEDLQAAESLLEDLMAVNKWTEGPAEVVGQVAAVSLDQPVSVFIRKTELGDKAFITVSKLTTGISDEIDLSVDLGATSVLEPGDPEVVTQYDVKDGKVALTLDTSKFTQTVTIVVQLEERKSETGDTITLVRGDVVNIEKPSELSGEVTWSAKFIKKDGTYIRNVGYNKIKRELKEENGKKETDGSRTAGDTLADHLLTVKPLSNGGATLIAREKGELVLVARDESGKEKVYPTTILFEDPDNLPEVTKEDYKTIRERWRESLVGTNISSTEGGAEILESIDKAARNAWDAYEYKGQDTCPGIPWTGDIGAAGSDIEYKDDAVEFRPAFQKVLAMARAYSTAGSQYHKNSDMLQDMIHIMDYLCTVCYTPKSQTDNWWTWEIGMSKDLIPILILLYDDLNEEQVKTYTDGLYFFQPDPYHEGAIGTGSTHAQGYRTAQGANIIDCSVTAIGLGVLREDNEQVYLGMLASSETFVIQEVENSAAIPLNGYTSGFYGDGSYLDHSHVPYTGAYGIEFMKGGVKIPPLLDGTPWQYPDEVRQNLEFYIVEGFGGSMYRGMMLDSLKGRSVSRPASSNRGAGREVMTIILQMADILSPEGKETALSAMKCWLEADPEFIDSLKGAENIAIRRKAQEILEDDSIESYVPDMHKSFPLMDRAVHRREPYLFALSMYSERIQNTEIMNDENKLGWHHGNGMTYIYDDDNQYTDNFWNTVNPYRLAGTTVVPMDIGNGKPDSSGFLQGGDFRSKESWVGGSAIGSYGISGMSFSGEIGGNGKSAADGQVSYAPNLRGKKSWFMFDDEIVCLGAGITNKGMDLPVETAVENKKLGEDGGSRLTIDGTVMDLPVSEGELKDIVNGTADVTGTPVDHVTWAHLEGNESAGTGYYFPYENTELNVRRARTTGNWKDVGTSVGESTQNYMEMWFDHGVNPEDASYGYVLLPGKTADETADYAQSPKAVILMNNPYAQAVHHEELGITGINFWEDQEVTVGDVTCDKKASVMVWEDEDGLLKVAVSDPTMRNTGTIKVKINKLVISEEELDGNVACQIQEDGGAVLTFQVKGTNGASSMASLRLSASIYPSAAALRPGENRIFEVRDYEGGADEITWSVKGSDGPLAEKTTIDSRGMLWVDQTEENNGLVVTARTESGLRLNAYISLGGDVVTAEMPEDVKKAEAKIDHALELLGALGADDPEVQKAVENAVTAVREADSDGLAEHIMDAVLRLAEAYIETRAETGAFVEERWEVNGKSIEKLNPAARGMVLNLSPDYKKAASTAVLVISGEDKAAAASEETGTPSNALRKARAMTAENTATPSFAFRANTKIDGKEVDKETVFRMGLSLFWEKEDEGISQLTQKVPYMVTINIPENIDPEVKILAVMIDEQGHQYPLSIEVDKEKGSLKFFPTMTGTVILANEAAEKPEDPKPEDPKPEDPKPEDPKPEDPKPEDPKPEDPKPEDPKPEDPKPEDPKPEDPKPEDPKPGDPKPEDPKPEDPKPEEPKPEEPKPEDPKPEEPGPEDPKPEDPKPDPEKPLYKSKRRYGSSENSYAGGRWVEINSQWKYQLPGGGYAVNCWEYINGQWYHFGGDGYMRTGWYFENQDGFWYYLKSDGAMATGWLQVEGKWYYFNNSSAEATGWGLKDGVWEFQAQENPGRPTGAMYRSAVTPDGYTVDEQGVWNE